MKETGSKFSAQVLFTLKTTSLLGQLAGLAVVLLLIHALKSGTYATTSVLEPIVWVSTIINGRRMYDAQVMYSILLHTMAFGAAISVVYCASIAAYLLSADCERYRRYKCLGEALWEAVFKPAHNYLAFLGCNASCFRASQINAPETELDFVAIASAESTRKNGSFEVLLTLLGVLIFLYSIKIKPVQLMFMFLVFVSTLIHNICVAVLIYWIRKSS